MGLEASSSSNYSSVISCFKIWRRRYQPPGVTGIAGAKLAQLDPDRRDPTAPPQLEEPDRRGKEGQTGGGHWEDIPGRRCLRLS